MAAMPKRKDWRRLLAPGLFQTQPLLLSLAELGGLQSLTMKFRTPPSSLFLTKNGPRKGPRRGSVAEGSKALDLGSSLFWGVGSNPTAASSDYKEGQTP